MDVDKELERYQLAPRAVVDTQRRGAILKFNAEVSFAGQSYILARNLATKEQAQGIANQWAEKMLRHLQETGREFLKDFLIAKG